MRGDCGFGFGSLINWCDDQGVGYALGFQATAPLLEKTYPVQIRAALRHSCEGDGCREYGDILY